MTTSYRVSLTEGNDFWLIGEFEWQWRAEFAATEFVKRIPNPGVGDWRVEVHEMNESGRKLIMSLSHQRAAGAAAGQNSHGGVHAE